MDHLQIVALAAALTAALATFGVPRAHAPESTTLPAHTGATAGSATLPPSSTDRARALKAPRGRATLLLSPFGEMPPPVPASYPQDPTVRTRMGLYATTAQAEELNETHSGDTAWVQVGCCSLDDVEVALGAAAGMAAAKDLAPDAPVFVSGASLHLAALAVDRLAEHGHTRVFLITR